MKSKMYIVKVTNGAEVLRTYACSKVEFCVGYVKISGNLLVVNEDERETTEVCIPTNLALVEKKERVS